MFFNKKNQKSLTLRDFVHSDINAFAIADLPRNLLIEAKFYAAFQVGGVLLNESHLDALNIGDNIKGHLEETFLQVLKASSLIVPKASKKKSGIYPWKVGLFFVSNLSLNATVKLSVDKSQNIAFIFLNFGLILQLLSRLYGLMSVPNFFESMQPDSVTRIAIDETGERRPSDAWFSAIPDNARKIQIASHCCVIAVICVLFHELSHFYRGHQTFLAEEYRFSDALFEVETDDQRDSSAFPDSIRRLLELDADSTAGGLAATFWRELDHPAISAEDTRNEAFFMQFLIGTICLYSSLEIYKLSSDYYSPIWRTQHFLKFFYRGFFALPKGVNYDNPESPENSSMVSSLYFKVADAMEAAERVLGWGTGYSTERWDLETPVLNERDGPALAKLQKRIRQYQPIIFFYK